MKIYRKAILPIALRVALFFPGISVHAVAASSCGSSGTTTTICDNQTQPYNVSAGENLIIEKRASIDVPQGVDKDHSDSYNLKYSAVNVGSNQDLDPVISVDSIENNGILQGSGGVTVTYSGSVGKLLNHGSISGNSGAIWVSGHIGTLDNDGVIKPENASDAVQSILLSYGMQNSGKGKIETIINRKGGSIDGISVQMAELNTLNNHGTLTSEDSFPDDGTIYIQGGGQVGIFNNDGTVTGPNHGIVITNGGYLDTLNNQPGGKGITADQDAIQVTGQDTSGKSSKIKQITNASTIYGKQNGIDIDDKGVVDTIMNLDGGVIQGDKFSIHNQGTITNGIDNAGTINGNVELGGATLSMSGSKATLNGDVHGTKDSQVIIGSKGSLDLTFTHDMDVGAVKVLSGSALRLGDGQTTGRLSGDIDNQGDLYFNRSDKATYQHNINGAGSVHQIGSGTTILTGANTYTGETKIESGTLQLGDNGTTGSIDKTAKVTIGQDGVLAFDHTAPTTFAADIEGIGTLRQQGTGDLTLTGNVATGKPITVTSGKLRFGDGTTIGKLSLSGIDNQGAVIVAGAANSEVTLGGEISGAGTLEVTGGKAIVTGDSTYSGQTTIGKGATLQLGNGGTGGNLAKSAILNSGTLTFNPNGTRSFDGAISANGHIDKIGSGITMLNSDSSAFTGSTSVEGGTLAVDGKLGTTASTLNVKNGGTVDGTGIIGGKTTIESGGHLTGKRGNALTFGHDLILSSGANVDISLGAENAPASALFNVHGDLTLAGTLNVTELSGFAVGEYDIFNYGGTLKNNGMTFTGGKPDSLSLDTNRGKEVYLTNTGGMLLNYWDGGDPRKYNNGTIDGGDGVWQVGGNHNWTSKTGQFNASWKNTDQFAIFAGTAGTVQVDDSGGNVTVNGMQFSSDGYKITGASLVLENDQGGSAKIRVGTGNKSKAGWVATIESDLTGSATLETTDYGTLILKGKNGYTGGTKVTRGVLQVGDGGIQGSISGDVAIGSEGKLVFNRADQMKFSGSLKGQGQLVQAGSGTTLLTGVNTYAGTTEVQGGTLRQGAEGAFSAVSSHTVGEHGTLDMGGFNATVSALNNSGTVLAGGDDKAVGRTLTITGNYSGNNGMVNLSTVLEGDNSKTDRLVVNGSTSGTTHLAIKNVAGNGAPTKEGIKVVEVQGTSDGTFSLAGDYRYKGEPAVVAGAYAYRLYKNGTDNTDGSWYLRSSLTSPEPKPDPKPEPKPKPEPPRLYHAGVSVYEAYGRVLQTLNTPETLRDRTEGRKAQRLGKDEFRSSAGEGSTDESTSNGAWGRMTASYGKLSPHVSTSGADAITYNMVRAQVGMDKRFYENNQGSVTGGGFLQYSNVNANVGSVHGEGNIRANGYTLGTTSTWHGNNQFYLDGLAQVTYFGNDLNSKTASRHLGDNKSALGYALSLEAGQQFDLTPEWSLTPQAQLAFSSVKMNDFHDTFGTKIRFDQSESMKLRLGTTIDYRQKWRDEQNKDGKAANLYGLFNIRQELLGRNDTVDVADVTFHAGNDRTWAESGVGGSYSWNDNNSFVYGQTSVNTSLNNFADSYELSAKIGLKATW
ncbi:autotransporter outer membrane beta-barrel domain-containing protein [Xenorhabdus doucetiae]|uniref:Outer membrane autotransporter protein n=1 Tax=Xenorhabdus doucetiae TaxID=351671 RepID=A0A068QU12_9GAMM|nr:autotransporter outer membrane beta-barrel domain-containing protein [Xenorhabdus doucetiae]TYP17224.1 outer membrane autotransporter protein [Xenorhabdus doucetiae]CDG17325.1 putative Outer membrane autotransporter barrel [Xenorhabdus doucetiae]